MAQAVRASREVRLLTGDTVRVDELADGTVRTALVGGHGDVPYARWTTAGGSWVVPAMSSAQHRVLDLSLFNVTELAAHTTRDGSVPVGVTMRAGAAPSAERAAVRALDLTPAPSSSTSTRARRAGGLVAYRGSYDPTVGGLDPQQLRGVASIRLADTAPAEHSAARGATGDTHRLTVQLDNSRGPLPGFAFVWVMNVEDSGAYTDQVEVGRGQPATFTVPPGPYGVVAWADQRLVLEPELDVDADTTVTLDLADATTTPAVMLEGYHTIQTALSVARAPAHGDSYPMDFVGPRFGMSLQPTVGTYEHGTLRTGVSATQAPDDRTGTRGSQPALAVTADGVDGVPADLTFAHHVDDFARVVQRFAANGAAGTRQTFLDAAAPGVDLWKGQELDVRVPSQRAVLLQAHPDAWYQHTFYPQSAPGDHDLTQMYATTRYRSAGGNQVLTFAHGPVGPGVDHPTAAMSVRRDGSRLRGHLPLLSGAGSSTDSFVEDQEGRWSLRRAGRTVAAGINVISFDVLVPAEPRTYVLRAESRPDAPGWDLSTRVADVWTFATAPGQRHPALVTPAYVPPSSLAGVVAPGSTSFGLRFTSLAKVRIARAAVQVSTDHGRHWSPAHVVRRGPATFAVRYATPAARQGRTTMSLRVAGATRSGDSVHETALDVYRLR